MKLPRDVDGPRLIKALSGSGYVATRPSGFHMRVTTQSSNPRVVNLKFIAEFEAPTAGPSIAFVARSAPNSVQNDRLIS